MTDSSRAVRTTSRGFDENSFTGVYDCKVLSFGHI